MNFTLRSQYIIYFPTKHPYENPGWSKKFICTRYSLFLLITYHRYTLFLLISPHWFSQLLQYQRHAQDDTIQSLVKPRLGQSTDTPNRDVNHTHIYDSSVYFTSQACPSRRYEWMRNSRKSYHGRGSGGRLYGTRAPRAHLRAAATGPMGYGDSHDRYCALTCGSSWLLTPVPSDLAHEARPAHTCHSGTVILISTLPKRLIVARRDWKFRESFQI